VALLHTVIRLYILVLLVAAIASWLPPQGLAGDIQRVLRSVTEPVLRPLRAILPMPRFGGVAIDLSIIVAIFVLNLVNQLLPW